MGIFMHCSHSTYVREVDCEIDAGIASMIGRLNRAGYSTAYCCSGLWADHMRIVRNGFRNDRGEEDLLSDIKPHAYVAFHFDKLSLKKISLIALATKASGATSKCHIGGDPLHVYVAFEFQDNHCAYLGQMVQEAKAMARRRKKNCETMLIKLVYERGAARSDFEVRRFWHRFEDALLGAKSSRRRRRVAICLLKSCRSMSIMASLDNGQKYLP